MTIAHRCAHLVACLSLGLLGACNFIFNPANSDDIVRCKNTPECERNEIFADALRTNRLDASCDAPGGGGSFTSSKTNQVCSVIDKVSVACGTEGLPASEFLTAINAAPNSLYAACPTENLGRLGCPPLNGNCDAGSVNENGLCDDGMGHPLYPANGELVYQDIKDQHCRSYFCDDDFVCNSKTNRCTRCDPDLGKEAFGSGACAEVSLSVGRSTVYIQGNDCSADDVSNALETQFGPPAPTTP